MSTSRLDNIVALFERGCLSAAMSKIEKMRNSNGDLSPAASRLCEQISGLRDAARDTSVELTEGALRWEYSKLVAKDMQERARTGTSPDEELINGLFGDNEQQCDIVLAKRNRGALYNESANRFDSIKSNMMRPLFHGNDRAAGWAAIRDGLRACPFVTLWHGRIELNDCTVRPPRIVTLARLTFDPRSEEEDVQRARDILDALDDTRDDSSHQADTPTIRWWAAFLQIDAKNWTTAQEVIKSVLMDCTVRGIWPAYYLPEALFLASMAEFGLGNQEACDQYLISYFDLADAMDRNRADAALLRLWAREERPSLRPPTLQCLCAQQLKKESCDIPELLEPYYGSDTEWLVFEELPKLRESLAEIWDEHTFAPFTWLRMEASRRIGIIEEENPYLFLVDHIEESWRRLNWRRPSFVDDIVRRFKESCGRTLTIRHVCHEKRSNEW